MNARPFRKVLVANRGEIAVRVLTACRTAGLATVAVASEADVGSRHARLADELVVLGPAPARESYLDAAKILDAARATGADAIHPGFGFLSENAAFARAVIDAGLRLDRPASRGDRGDGAEGRLARADEGGGRAGRPGLARSLARRASRRVGLPLVVKASAGGGGKGMRVVRSEGRARRGDRVVPAGGGSRLRGRDALRRAVPRAAAARRGPGLRRRRTGASSRSESASARSSGGTRRSSRRARRPS